LKVGRNITWGSNNEIFWKTLQIFYDRLIKIKQDMFWDIAYFFIGFQKSTFCQMYWNADGLSSPMFRSQNLKDKSLMKWAKDGSL